LLERVCDNSWSGDQLLSIGRLFFCAASFFGSS